MKIVAGLGSVEDYIALVEAGTDEVFCGFVTYEWNKKYGNRAPINRREVLLCNVQINGYEEMKILKRMENKYRVPVTVAFNYLYYTKGQYQEIITIMKNLIDIGFRVFIVADPALLLYIKKYNLDCSIQLSGECAEINSHSMSIFNELNISRYIFHRKNTIEDMKNCIFKNGNMGLQYEAFILNEKCHYSGAYCNSLHCDEMVHLCKVPYVLTKGTERINIESSESYEEDYYIPGMSGCGICALKRLKEAGITHLKVVGRGSYVEYMEKDIKALKEALLILDSCNGDDNFCQRVKRRIFNNHCSGNCYYL